MLADKAGNLPTAIQAYTEGLGYLLEHLKNEQDPKAQAGIAAKVSTDELLEKVASKSRCERPSRMLCRLQSCLDMSRCC